MAVTYQEPSLAGRADGQEADLARAGAVPERALEAELTAHLGYRKATRPDRRAARSDGHSSLSVSAGLS